MKTLRLHLMVPVLALACSSPTAPTPASVAKPAVRGVALSMTIAPDSDPATGFHSPTSLTLRATDEVGPANIQSAVFRMLDDRGTVLAQAAITTGDPVPQDAYLSGNVVVQTLNWPIENGRGRSIDGSLTIRGSSGELRTLALSIPTR